MTPGSSNLPLFQWALHLFPMAWSSWWHGVPVWPQMYSQKKYPNVPVSQTCLGDAPVWAVVNGCGSDDSADPCWLFLSSVSWEPHVCNLKPNQNTNSFSHVGESESIACLWQSQINYRSSYGSDLCCCLKTTTICSSGHSCFHVPVVSVNATFKLKDHVVWSQSHYYICELTWLVETACLLICKYWSLMIL